MPDALPDRPRFFGRRHGRPLRASGRGLIETLLPRLAIDLASHGRPLDPQSLFAGRPASLWLEIGFGAGEHLARQAALHPEIGFIGCEVYVNGIATLLGHIERHDLANIRVFPDDARLLLPALPDACLNRVFLLFPDPWPKKRHAERRFVAGANLDSLARLMEPGAELRVATDDDTYKAWLREQFASQPDFVDLTENASLRPVDWEPTRYEAKALREGRSPIYLRYSRRA